MSIIEHFTYQAARAELRVALDNFRPGHMVFLIGPSGAGKTTLRHAVMQEIFGNPSYWGAGRIPAIQTFSMLPNNAYYSSREMVKSLVEQLHVPNLSWLFDGNISLDQAVKQKMALEIENAHAVWSRIRNNTLTEGEYWRVFARLLPARGCKYVSIEQATGLLKNRRNTLPADHTLHLMSIAESAGVMFIMTGVAECAELWSVHHELRRRVIPVWFRPYTPKRKGDHVHFLRLLKTLSPRYALSRPDLLFLMADDIMSVTAGLLGHIVRLMEHAQIRAKAEGSQTIKKGHIANSFYSEKDLARVWKDVHDFEEVARPADVHKLSARIQAEWESAGATKEEVEDQA